MLCCVCSSSKVAEQKCRHRVRIPRSTTTDDVRALAYPWLAYSILIAACSLDNKMYCARVRKTLTVMYERCIDVTKNGKEGT